MDLFELLNFYLVPGIVLGSIYALGAVGITLIFAILRYAHLAHGDLATLGAFIALAVVTEPWRLALCRATDCHSRDGGRRGRYRQGVLRAPARAAEDRDRDGVARDRADDPLPLFRLSGASIRRPTRAAL